MATDVRIAQHALDRRRTVAGAGALNERLAVSGLSKRYGTLHALHHVSFAVAAGEVVGLLGPNGAGKTSTIEAILGLVVPDGGDIRGTKEYGRGRIGAVLQSTGLQDKITPREALTLFAHLHGVAPDPSALLDRFGLRDKADSRYATLSGGQRQRLALALAFVGAPGLVLLDEPTTGLDPHGRNEFHAHVRAIRDQGVGVLLATHDMAEAEALCDRLVLLDRGRVLADGRPAALLGETAVGTHVVLGTSAALGERPAFDSIADVQVKGAELRFTARDLNRALGDLVPWLDARGIAILAMRAGPPTLEEVLLGLTRGSGA